MNTVIQASQPVYLISAEVGAGAQLIACQAGANLMAESIFDKYKYKINCQEKLRVIQSRHIQKKIDCVAEFIPRLAKKVTYVLQKKGFPVILGGDHSCAIGTWSAIADYYLKASETANHLGKYQLNSDFDQKSEIGLIWIDAHLDSHTPNTSPSHAPHGMSLASLLGFGPLSLTNLYDWRPKLHPKNVAIIGARSFETEEVNLLKKLGVKIFYKPEVVYKGFQNCFLEAKERVKRNTKKYGISFDLDVIDPMLAPGVGSPELDGLDIEEVVVAFKNLKSDPFLCAFELVEFNPFLDKNNKTLEIGLSIIEKIFENI